MLRTRSDSRLEAAALASLAVGVGVGVGAFARYDAEIVPIGVVLALALALVATVDWTKSLYVTAFLLPFEALSIGSSGGVVRFALAMTLVGWTIALSRSIGLRRHLATIIRLRESRLLGVLLVWLTASAIWAYQPSTSFRVLSTWYGLAMLVVLTAMLDRTQLARLWIALALGAVAALPLSFFLGKTNEYFAEGFNRVAIGGSDPNETAVLIAIVVVVGASFAYQARWHRVLAAYLSVLLLGGIAVSGSRTAAIALGTVGIATIGIVTLHRARRPRLPPATRVDRSRTLSVLAAGLIASAVIAFSAAAFFGTTISVAIQNSTDRLVSLQDFDPDSDLARRPDVWRQSVATWQTSPVIGVGIGNSAAANGNLNPDVENVPHNSALTIAVEVGAIGLLIYGAFWWATMAQCLAQARRGDPYAIALGLGFMVWFVASLALSLQAERSAFLIVGSVLAIAQSSTKAFE